MRFIAIKTKDGGIEGKLSFYCRMPEVRRQSFYKYPANKGRPWKYRRLADAMQEILASFMYQQSLLVSIRAFWGWQWIC